MNEAQSRAWFALVAIAQMLPHALDAQLTADAGLINFEYAILRVLNIAPNQTARIGELATAVDSPKPRLSKAIRRLEARGLVGREPCASDGPAVNVQLSREGRRVWLKATPPHITLARDTLLADYTDEQLIQLATLLQPLLKRLDPEASLGSVRRLTD
jgi:DNA-binding MarR family transcriptional regulator